MFYREKDKVEIRSWLKKGDDALRKEIQDEIIRQLSNYITRQHFQNYSEASESQFEFFNGKVSSFEQEITSLKISSPQSDKVDALKKEIANLTQESALLKNSNEILKKEVVDLKQKVATLQTSAPSAEVDSLKRELANLKNFVTQVSPLLMEINLLKREIAELKQKIATSQTSAPSAEVDSLKREIAELKQKVATSQTSAPLAEVDSLKREIAELKQKVATSQTFAPLAEVDSLKREITELKQKIATSQTFAPLAEVDSLKREITELKQKVATSQTSAPSAEIDSLKREITELKQKVATSQTFAPLAEVDSLKREIANLKQKVATSQTSAPPAEVETKSKVEPPEKIFYLPELKDVFIPNDRKQILKQVKAVLSTGDIEKYLATNPSETTKQFQKLLANHIKDAKKFVDKLNLNDLEDAELSESVTTKYFKLFHRIIFDNFLIAIKRGLLRSEKFHSGLLVKINEYLSLCGIYSVNATSGRKAEDEDYENMTPQTLKTNDKTLTGTINEIERLPYRINYLDEFGEQRFFQYAGVMNVYKAV